METIWRTRALALGLAAMTVAALLPAADLPVARAQGSCQDVDVVGYITLSHPLTEQITATAVLYLVVAPKNGFLQSNRNLVNGVDAFVVDLFCNAFSATYCLTGSDNGLGEYDLQLAFFTSTLSQLDIRDDADSPDVCDGSNLTQQTVPPGTRYVLISLIDGVPAAGLTPVFPTRPYSARVHFQMDV